VANKRGPPVQKTLEKTGPGPLLGATKRPKKTPQLGEGDKGGGGNSSPIDANRERGWQRRETPRPRRKGRSSAP